MNKKKLTSAFIVDDSRDAVELLRRMLESNYSVEVVGTAFDAEEAAAKIVNTDPDLIFLDVELPTMSGLEFCCSVERLEQQMPHRCFLFIVKFFIFKFFIANSTEHIVQMQQLWIIT